jgi:transposase, IS30 family
MIGKLDDRTTCSLNQRCIQLLERETAKFKTITADNGTEFHQYPEIEGATGVRFYFATPHHSWERGTNENTNGLIRQYLPKGMSMKDLTQAQCDRIAERLNSRPVNDTTTKLQRKFCMADDYDCCGSNLKLS